MDARHRGIQIFGWLSVIAGYCLALLLIRGIFIGITQGFAGHPNAFWVVLGYLLSFALAVYLFTVGRRAISIAKGSPRPRARIGWGRMLFGALLIFSAATAQFDLLPLRHFVRRQEHQNHTDATARNVTAIAIYIGCGFLIVSGLRRASGDKQPSQT